MLVDQIILHEGLKLKPYVDPVGKVTIGVGRNLTDNGITSMEAMLLLDHDLDAAVADCASFPWFAKLDAIRQRVVVDMRFNLGPTRFRGFAKMLTSVESGDFVMAADRMLKSKWATQVKSRAQRLARMMATGVALLLLCAAVAQAQPDVVAHVKSDLVARGVSLAGTCGALQITKRVAWLLRMEGWGLVRKPAGENCDGFSGDKIVASSGRFVDLLIDQGGANTPAWQERAATADELAARVEPVDPGDSAQTPAPAPPPAPTPINDEALVLAKLDALSAQLKAHDESPSYFVKIFGNRYVQLMLAAAATYFTQHQLTK